MARSIRRQPFCWQEKKILRIFRKVFEGSELSKYRNLYGAITEMDSDFNGKNIKYYTKTIGTYSGLSPDWIPKGLKTLEKMGIIKIRENRSEGRFGGKYLIFTPETAIEIQKNTVTVKPGNGKTVNGFSGTLEDSSFLEDISLLENNISLKNKNKKENDFVKPLRKKRQPSEKQKLILDNKQTFIQKIKDIYPAFKTDTDGFKRLDKFYEDKILNKQSSENTKDNETYFIKNLEAYLEYKEKSGEHIAELKYYVGTPSKNSKNYHENNYIEKLKGFKEHSKQSSRPKRKNNAMDHYAYSGNAAQEMMEAEKKAKQHWEKTGEQTEGFIFGL